MAAAFALGCLSGPAGALSAPDEFEFTLAPTAAPSDFELALLLKRSFADVLTLSALIEPSWTGPGDVSSVVLSVSDSPSFAGALFSGTPDNPSYELAYFDGNGDLVLGTVDASPANPVTAFTWMLRFGPQTPPDGTILARLNVEQLDLGTFDSILLTGAQTLAVPVPEPATWVSLAAGLLVVGAVARRRVTTGTRRR